MKRTLTTLMFISPALLFAQEKYTIKGKIGNFSDPSIVFLSYRVNGNSVRDSSVLKNGAFEFNGTVETPVSANLTFIKDRKGRMMASQRDVVTVYLQKGTITVNTPDSIMENAVVAGTTLNADYQRLQKALAPIKAKRADLNKEYASATNEERSSESFRNNFTEKNSAIREEERKILADYISKNPKTSISLDALRTYGGSVPDNVAKIETLYNSLSPEVKNSAAGKEYATYLANQKRVAIGTTAPEFEQNDPEGNVVKLTDFRGKYVLIDFWASWCGPCRAENPHVVKAYNEYKDKNFTILGVSLDQPTGKEAWLKAIKDDGLTWTQVSDLKFWNNDVAKSYAVRAIPQNFLLDPQGKIVAKNLRGDALAKKLAELLQ